VGSLAGAVDAVSGSKPSILWVDATRELLEVVDNRVATKRGAIARLLNPKWIEEMLRHGCSGALQIAERVDHLFGLQATTCDVEEWVWHELLRGYLTGSVKERTKQHDPWALKHAADRLYEAYQRGYWKPDESELELLYAAASEAELLVER
jgi:cobaltochelatase CobN